MVKKTKKSSVKQESPIHIKIDYIEARKGKKEILSSQINSINMIKILQRYRELRTEELEKKQMISKKIKEIKTNLSKLQKVLPALKIPKILERSHETSEIEVKTKPKITKHHYNLNEELQLIQNKLKALQE